MKIGLFGGSFNPPHAGHMALAQDFYQASGIDLLIIMPSFLPPHKAPSGIQAADRLRMTRLACLTLGEQGVNYTVSDYEIQRHDISYTYETVRYLLQKYKEPTLSLCVGSDMFLSFETWKNAEELLRSCRLYTKARHIGERPALDAHARWLQKRYGTCSTIMDGVVCDISSTELRTTGRFTDSGLLDTRVRDYAEQHRLYGNAENLKKY